MENILLNFQSDTSGVRQGIDALVELEVVDKGVADQAKKTAAEYEKRDKKIKDGTQQSTSQVEKMAAAFKGLDKSIVGGAYDKKLAQLKKELGGTNSEFKVLQSSVDLAKKKLDTLNPNSQEWRELNDQIQLSESLLTVFGDTTEQSEAKTVSMKTRLRELKQELQQMEDAGLDGTDTFNKLAIEAARLEDQIGDTNERIRALSSDTANMDALVEGIGLIGTGFQLATGAEALFGEENEDLQKALVKLNAIMAITQSIQQAQNFLRGQSILMLKAEAAGNAILAGSTRLTAAAYSALGINVVATSAAFKILRAAIITTGIGALVVGIGFLVDKILSWTSASEDAEKQQLDLAKATRELNSAIVEQNSLYVQAVSADRDAMQKRLEILQSSGGSQLAQLQLRKRIADEDRKIGEESLRNLGLTENKLLILENDLNSRLLKVQAILESSKGDVTDAQKEATKRLLEVEQAQIDAIQPMVDAGRAALGQVESAATESQKIVAETNRLIFENSLKSATAYAEARALLAEEGSRVELEAQINAIKVASREQLANVNLTAGERFKIEVETNRKIADLKFAYEQRILQQQAKSLDSKAALEKEGSRERLNLELDSLEKQKQAELQTSVIVNGQLVKLKELTEEQKQEIEDRYLKLSSDKIREYARADAEAQLNARASLLNSSISELQLATDAATNGRLLEQRKQLIDAQAQLEIVSINDTVHNEEERRARVKAVYAKALADKIQLEREKQRAEIENSAAFRSSATDIEISRLTTLQQRLTQFSSKRKELEDQAHFLRLQQFQQETNTLVALHTQKLISDEEYARRSLDIEKRMQDEKLSYTMTVEQRKLAIQELAIQTAMNLTNAMFASARRGYAAEEERVRQLYDQKKISEEEYNQQLKQLRRQQDADAKAQAVFQTLIQQGPAVLKGFQDGGFAGVAAAFALFFSLLSAVQGAELPAYKEGEVLIKGPGTETSDSILARISRNESVINAAQSKKHEGALRAINEDRYTDYLKTVELPKYFSNLSLPTLPEYVVHNTQGPVDIDYDKLGDVIAQKLAENPQYHFSFDIEGFKHHMQQGNDITEFKNQKLNR